MPYPPDSPESTVGQPLSTPLSILTIYEHPLDYPTKYVVREFILDTDGQLYARKACNLADTLEEARLLIPPGRVCFLEPNTKELPAVESWVCCPPLLRTSYPVLDHDGALVDSRFLVH